MNCIVLVRSILHRDFGIQNVHHRRVIIHILNSSDLHRKWLCFGYISAETKQHDLWAQTSAWTLLTIPAVSSDAWWPDNILTPLQERVRACHFLFVQQGQRADGQVEFSRVLKNTLIHACVLHNTHSTQVKDHPSSTQMTVYHDYNSSTITPATRIKEIVHFAVDLIILFVKITLN